MATRDRPYGQFNFLVDLGSGTDGAQAGFQDVSGLDLSVTMMEYRPGNYKENTPMKLATLSKMSDVSLKRGVIGAVDLWQWIEAVRDGKQGQLKTVTISLQDEAHASVAMKWVLTSAQPTKYTGPTLSGKTGDLAIEELVLAYERLEVSA